MASDGKRCAVCGGAVTELDERASVAIVVAGVDVHADCAAAPDALGAIVGAAGGLELQDAPYFDEPVAVFPLLGPDALPCVLMRSGMFWQGAMQVMHTPEGQQPGPVTWQPSQLPPLPGTRVQMTAHEPGQAQDAGPAEPPPPRLYLPHDVTGRSH